MLLWEDQMTELGLTFKDNCLIGLFSYAVGGWGPEKGSDNSVITWIRQIYIRISSRVVETEMTAFCSFCVHTPHLHFDVWTKLPLSLQLIENVAVWTRICQDSLMQLAEDAKILLWRWYHCFGSAVAVHCKGVLAKLVYFIQVLCYRKTQSYAFLQCGWKIMKKVLCLQPQIFWVL